MEFKQLLYFLEITRETSFTRAAQKLGLSQPALSKQIELLEREFATVFIERSSRQFRLTPAGLELQKKALDILELYQSTKENIGNRKETATISLASGTSIAVKVLPQVLLFLKKVFPNISFKVYEGDSIFVNNALLSGKVDIAILTEKWEKPSYTKHYFMSDTILPAVSQKSKCAKLQKRDRLDFTSFFQEPLLFYHPGSSIRQISDEILAPFRDQFHLDNTHMQFQSIFSILQYIKLDFGVGFLSSLFQEKGLTFIDKEELQRKRDFYLCYRTFSKQRLEPIVQQILNWQKTN
ncbi:MAG: LysR family transcriptional regulator [Spirochaetota bacterium]